MRVKQDRLIEELLGLTDRAIHSAQQFRELPLSELNHKPSPNSWSVLECIEHLNLYGDFYLPEIEKQLLSAESNTGTVFFKSGLWGNYFVKVIKPDSGKKLKATKPMDPTRSEISPITIDRFMKQLEKLKSLLQQSKKVNLTKVKTAISLTKLVKLRMGDTFRFLVFHNQRHLLQAQRVIDGIPANRPMTV